MSQSAWMDAQYGVLGSMLLWSELIPKVLLETRPEYFTGPCRTLYDVIARLDQDRKAVDVITVGHALGDEKYRQFMVELMDFVPSSAAVDQYVAICREQYRSTTIRGYAQQLALCQDAGEMEKLVGQINSLMVDKPGLQIMDSKTALEDFYREQTTDPKYLSWPLKKLDGRVYARPGNFIIIGGTPSTGKSAWALQCATHFAQKYRVGFFSLETDNQTLRDREYASIPGLSMDQIQQRRLTDRAWEAVAQHTTMLLSRNFDRISAAGYTVADIRSVTTMKRYDVIFVDYLQLIRGSGSNRAEEVAGISMALHTMAQSMGVTIIALSQLKRNRDGGSPSMSDLRESGQIEQDADIVMILQLEDDTKPEGPRGLYIAKNKQGRRFKVLLAFDGSHQIFSEARLDGSHFQKPTVEPPKGNRRPYDIPPPDQDDQMELADDDPDFPQEW